MTPDNERRAAERLRDAWDHQGGGLPLPTSALDPGLGETIEHLQALYRPPAPDALFIETLGRTLMPPPAPDGAQRPPAYAPNGHTPLEMARGASPLPPAAPRGWAARVLPGFAVAALIALALLTGLVTLRANQPVQPREEPFPAREISQPTVPPAAAITTLLSTTLPAGQVPETGVLQFFIWRLAIDPEASTPASPEGTCCHGPQFTHVLAGELTVHVAGPMLVLRGQDQLLDDPLPPGANVVLQPGDTVIHDFSIPSEYTNAGTTPVQIVNAGLYTGSDLPFWSNAVRYLDGTQEFHRAPFPPGPVTFSLLQATLPPDGVFPAPPPGALAIEVGQDGDAGVGKNGDGSFVNIMTTDQTIYTIVAAPGGRPDLAP